MRRGIRVRRPDGFSKPAKRAGKPAPVKYSHRCSARGKSVGRGMPLAFCLEAETRILL